MKMKQSKLVSRRWFALGGIILVILAIGSFVIFQWGQYVLLASSLPPESVQATISERTVTSSLPEESTPFIFNRLSMRVPFTEIEEEREAGEYVLIQAVDGETSMHVAPAEYSLYEHKIPHSLQNPDSDAELATYTLQEILETQPSDISIFQSSRHNREVALRLQMKQLYVVKLPVYRYDLENIAAYQFGDGEEDVVLHVELPDAGLDGSYRILLSGFEQSDIDALLQSLATVE